MKKLPKAALPTFFALSLLIACTGCKASPDASPPDALSPPQAGGYVKISFDFARQSGSGSNQFALWIEDGETGQLVETLAVSSFTAGGGYAKRPNSVTQWQAAAKPAQMDSSQLDAISMATPPNGRVELYWSYSEAGEAASYSYVLEATLRNEEYAVYRGPIPDAAQAMNIAEVQYFPAEAASSDEAVMIANVTAEYFEAGE